MSDHIKKGRSPSAPKTTLVEAIESVGKLHAKAGRSNIKPEVAIIPLGYTSMNGAAVTALATLKQYGLIDREHGGNLAVSDLAVKLLHSKGEEQTEDARRTAALKPPIFAALYDGYHDCSAEVLASHLIQDHDFTADSAKLVASIYRENAEFANLNETRILPSNQQKKEAENAKKETYTITPISLDHIKTEDQRPARMLAQYTFPLGPNQATLVFTGQKLTADDFDALIDFVEFSKRQFERAQKIAPQIEEVPPSPKVADEYIKYHGSAYKSESGE